MVYYVLMGLLDRFTAKSNQQNSQVDVAAAIAPYNAQQLVGGILFGTTIASREQFMAIPSGARARGIICSTVGSLPLEQYNHFTNEHVRPNRVIMQPDPRVAGSAIYAWIAEDLLLYGVAYGMVMDAYAATDASRIRAWTRIAPNRVFASLNNNSTEIEYYTVDGKRVPPFGLGSLIVFNGLDEGILNRAGRTIKAAAALEQAAEMYAREPMPQMVLKSNGTNLTPERITKLLESWKISRSTRSTAFLNADVELQTLGFDPKSLQMNEARQYLALEIARASGIPASFISAETTSMTYTNTVAERKALIDFSLRPILTAIEQRLSAADFCPNGIETRFDIDDFLRGSALERAQVYEILNRIGAMSIEQIQEEEDLIR
jgi:HK97 family phage portal protein